MHTEINGGIYKRIVKRPMDVILSLIAIIVLSPLMLVVAVLIRIILGSPVIFKQKRPGLNEKIFTLYKFRTMNYKRKNNGELMPDSMRINKFGKFLRFTSLDELPELFNIIKGDMSVIGPRPLLPKYLQHYSKTEKLRHSVRPGLSGLAQVNGRNNLYWDSRLAKDIEYVENISFLLDVKIIFKTIIKVFKREDITVVNESILKDLDVERNNSINIKKLEYEDFKANENIIFELLLNTYMTNFQFSYETGKVICKEKLKLLDQYIKKENALLIGAYDDNNLVGFLWMFKQNYFGEIRMHINQIAVSDSFKGKGAGKRLMKEAENETIKHGIDTIDLFVSETNLVAVNMYEKLGFTTERRYIKKKL